MAQGKIFGQMVDKPKFAKRIYVCSLHVLLILGLKGMIGLRSLDCIGIRSSPSNLLKPFKQFESFQAVRLFNLGNSHKDKNPPAKL